MTGRLAEVLHMNGGNDELSYANNSLFPKTVIEKATPILTHAIKSMVEQDVFLDDNCFKVADLGCSSSMNTLLVASNIIDVVYKACQENNRTTPCFQVFLNDLIMTDFNSIFQLLPDFYKRIRNGKGENFGHCFISAVPGSFYDRLFPDKSLHLVHSSYSVHWLSQVPMGIENNKLSTYIAKTSPPNVSQAYKTQFHTDFTKFLQLRYEEIVHRGRMILTLHGRSSIDPANYDSCTEWELLGATLVDMVKEGLVQETDVNSFNFLVYFPHQDELRNIIEANGLFSLDNLNIFEVTLDPNDSVYIANMNEFTDDEHGKNIANRIRAINESLLTAHFGNSIIDVLFKKFGEKVAKHLGIRKATKVTSVAVSLTKV